MIAKESYKKAIQSAMQVSHGGVFQIEEPRNLKEKVKRISKEEVL